VECCGVTVAQAATLEALLRHDGALRLGELSTLLGISPSTLTRNLARLEERRLVERVADPADRRASRVQLTAAGRAAAGEVEQLEQQLAAAILANLPGADAEPVLQSLQDLLIATRIATESCCPGAFDHLMADGARGCCRPPASRPPASHGPRAGTGTDRDPDTGDDDD